MYDTTYGDNFSFPPGTDAYFQRQSRIICDDTCRNMYTIHLCRDTLRNLAHTATSHETHTKVRRGLHLLTVLEKLCMRHACLAQAAVRLHTTPPENFAPIPARLRSLPSAATQLFTAKTIIEDSLASNYYQILSTSIMEIDPSSTTTLSPSTSLAGRDRLQDRADTANSKRPSPNFCVDDLDSIIKSFTDADTPHEETTKPSAIPTIPTYRHKSRFIVRLKDLAVKASVRERLSVALKVLQEADPSAVILPFKKDDLSKHPPIYTAADIPLGDTQLRTYLKLRASTIKTELRGQIHIGTIIAPDVILAQLRQGMFGNKIDLRMLQCQSEETIVIGFLLRSSETINRRDLAEGIRQHRVWDNTTDESDFFLSWQPLHAGNKKAMCMMVEATAAQAATTNAKFEKLYDGVNRDLPQGVEMLYIPVIKNSLSDADRVVFVREQQEFSKNERKVTLGGIHDIETMIPLADNKTQATIRQVLMSISATRTPERRRLFLSVDRVPNNVEVFTARLNNAVNGDDAVKLLGGITSELKKIFHPSAYQLVFQNPEEGLRYGGPFTGYGGRTPIGVPSPDRRTHISQIRAQCSSPHTAIPTTGTPSGTHWYPTSRPVKTPAWQTQPFAKPTDAPTSAPAPTPPKPHTPQGLPEYGNLRSDLDSLQVNLETFKSNVHTELSYVHDTMNAGFNDMRELMAELFGTQGSSNLDESHRNVRQRITFEEVDSEL